MKILETKVMRGPNMWSNYRKHLIVLKLDIETLESLPTNKIDGFSDRLEKLIPTLYSHCCSEGHEGGFFERVKEGTWMGHVVEHIALEIQTLAGMECGYGRTRSTVDTGVYHVVFSYKIEQAGLYAAKAAVRIAEALINNEEYDLNKDIEELKYLHDKYAFGPSTASIIDEAKKRGIPYKRLSSGSYVAFGYGNKQKTIRATITGNTSNLGVEIACDKDETKKLLANAYIPVPAGRLVYDEEELREALEIVSFPLVIKPVDGNHGRGVITNIINAEQALAAFRIAKGISKEVIVEEFIQGSDYRFLVINYKLVAVAKRTPAMVMGDGKSTIAELVEQTNKDPERGEGHEKVMTTIKIDEITLNILAGKNLTVDSILPLGEILFLKDSANISTGGTSTDVTDKVHPYNKFIAERVARLLNLDICGIDVVAKDINVPLSKEVGGIVEVNACPGLRMHLAPAKGIARNVAEPIIDMLFPNKDNGRIPLVAITGTNGKTTTTRLIAHMMKQMGHNVGFTTTDGIYVGDHAIHHGDCTGPASADTILNDPTVDFAVLECARGGILRSGLGFDTCDISVVTNVTEDHLGLKDIHTIEDMARVKAVVARSTAADGYCILNADDDLVYNMRHDVDSKVALFSIHADNERIKEHCANGGLAAIIEKGYITICKGKWKTRLDKIANVPLSFNGRAECMIKNILPAVLTAVISNYKYEDITAALQSFIPSPEQTPGRMNLFKFKDFEVMVDYAHNTDGFTELKKFMDKTKASVKIGIISGTGDRREEDIRNLGKLAAQIFDEIVIRHDVDMRGMDKNEMTRLIMEGIYSEKDMPIRVISNEEEAIRHTLENAKKGAFIFLCADSVLKTIEYVNEAKRREDQSNEPYTYKLHIA